MITMGEGIKLTINPIGEYPIDGNFSFTISDGDVIATAEGDPEYEQFLADVWVGVVLTLMVLSCVCCMCSCLLYHKFQQWKRNVIEARTTANLEAGTLEVDLPSYTIASGLPTYQEALEQLKIVKELTGREKTSSKNDTTKTNSASPLSVVSLFQNYNTKSSNNDLKN